MADEQEKKPVGAAEIGSGLAAAGVTLYGSGYAGQRIIGNQIAEEGSKLSAEMWDLTKKLQKEFTATHAAPKEMSQLTAYTKSMDDFIANHADMKPLNARLDTAFEKSGALMEAGFIKKPFAVFAKSTTLGKVGIVGASVAAALAVGYGVHKWRNRVKEERAQANATNTEISR